MFIPELAIDLWRMVLIEIENIFSSTSKSITWLDVHVYNEFQLWPVGARHSIAVFSLAPMSLAFLYQLGLLLVDCAMHTRHSVDLWVSIVAAIGSLRDRVAWIYGVDKMGKGTDISRQHLATKHTLCKSIEPSVLQNPFFGLFFHGPTLTGPRFHG